MIHADSPETPETSPTDAMPADVMSDTAADSSFGDILSQFEQSHHTQGGTLEGTVVSVTADAVFVDIGRKTDGVLPPDPTGTLKPGVKVIVSIRGRDDEGNLMLSAIKVEVPKE